VEQTPGIKTSEGVTAIVAVLTPLAAAIGKLEGWPLVAALGVAAVVASVYIAMRTWLKVKGGPGAAALLVFLLAGSSAFAGEAPPTKGEIVLSRDRQRGAWRVADYRLLADASTPAAEVRPLPPAPVEVSEPAPAPSAPPLATLPDCISQGAANAALACVSGKAPPPSDRKTFWITWGTSMGSTVATAALAWITNHYVFNPDPVK